MICKKCNIEKTEDEMKTKYKCKACHNEYTKHYNSLPENKAKKNKRDIEYYNKNREKIRERINEEYHNSEEARKIKKEHDRKYRESIKNDPEKLKEFREYNRLERRKARSTPEGLAKSREHSRKYGKANREKINARRRERMKKNPNERLADNLRKAIRRVIKAAGIQKTWRGEITQDLTQSILDRIGPCPGDNYHLDHIIPISVFDLTKKEHRELANSPYNLRWLIAEDNLSKNDTIDYTLIEAYPELKEIAVSIGLLNI